MAFTRDDISTVQTFTRDGATTSIAPPSFNVFNWSAVTLANFLPFLSIILLDPTPNLTFFFYEKYLLN